MAKPLKKQPVPDTLIKVSKQGVEYKQKSYETSERAYGDTQDAEEEYVEVILEKTAAEIIDQINKRVKSPYYSIFCAVAGFIQTLIYTSIISGIFGSDLLTSLIFLFCVSVFSAGTFLAYRADVKRKTTPLFYEFSDDYSEDKFNQAMSTFESLSSTQRAWRLKSRVAISDWKRNAGSNASLIRQKAKVGKQNPKLLTTNVEVWGVDAGSIKLYLLPDKFFVFQDGVYSAVPYSEIQTSFKNLEYVERESLPSDSTVIGHTWKYVRRDGGPDRRFKNNKQLPIVDYGVVGFQTQNFVAYLIVSSLKASKTFTRAFSSLLQLSGGVQSKNSMLNETFEVSSIEEESNLEHLEPLKKAAQSGKKLTTGQVAKILGVSNSFITKNSDSFDYEGFRFARAGKSGRQILWSIEIAPRR